MRDLTQLENYRDRPAELKLYGSNGNAGNGVFMISYKRPGAGGRDWPLLLCIASNGGGWDHVSVSKRNRRRIPTWEEMDYIKRLFFLPTEMAVQFHPPEANHINIVNNCLHLWRPQGGTSIASGGEVSRMAMPPEYMV